MEIILGQRGNLYFFKPILLVLCRILNYIYKYLELDFNIFSFQVIVIYITIKDSLDASMQEG